ASRCKHKDGVRGGKRQGKANARHVVNVATDPPTTALMGGSTINLGGLNSSPTPNSHRPARRLRFVNVFPNNYAPGNVDT
ncbi:hypothetical protein FRC00_007134, partial [Tulasnella sp. 408]